MEKLLKAALVAGLTLVLKSSSVQVCVGQYVACAKDGAVTISKPDSEKHVGPY